MKHSLFLSDFFQLRECPLGPATGFNGRTIFFLKLALTCGIYIMYFPYQLTIHKCKHHCLHFVMFMYCNSYNNEAVCIRESGICIYSFICSLAYVLVQLNLLRALHTYFNSNY